MLRLHTPLWGRAVLESTGSFFLLCYSYSEVSFSPDGDSLQHQYERMEKTKHSVLWGCVWLMTEVCVAVGTLSRAADQSFCKTNLTLTDSLTHLLPPPSTPSNPQLLAAKCTQHAAALINHPKQSMFNLWHAGLTRKFITCCRRNCMCPDESSLYLPLWNQRKSGETKCATKKANDGGVFNRNHGDKALLYSTVLLTFHGGWQACVTFSTACAKRFGDFFSLSIFLHICTTWKPNHILWIRGG